MTLTLKPASKRPRGRPGVLPEQRLLAGSIRLTGAQWDKLELLGDGEWLRKQIDKAKVKHDFV